MKRIGLALASASAFVLAVAVPALATDGSSLPNRPEVSGSGGSAGGGAGGTAFTGSDVSTTLMLMIALVVIGSVMLYVSRRRAATVR